MTPFIFNPKAEFSNLTFNSIDIGFWTVGTQTLLLAANLNYNVAMLDLSSIPTGIQGTSAMQVFDGGAQVYGKKITFQSIGTGVFLLS
jgi:hypothetical protein